MKTLASVLLTIVLTMPLAEARGRWMRFHATAYSRGGQTVSGNLTREGHTVAADPSVLPLGTRIQVRGAGPYDGVYVVQDSGRKIGGREVDIFIDDPVAAKRFGNKPVQVRVIRPAPKQAAAAR